MPGIEVPQILGERGGVAALFKPGGMDVFGARSLCAWLLGARPELAEIGPADAPAIVHRLDRGTSGVVLVACEPAKYEQLRRAFSAERVAKTYLALIEGELDQPVVVELPLGARYRRSKKVLVALPGRKLRAAQSARTEVHPLQSAGLFSLCRVEMRSGVRHQIRAHLAHLGHPVAGDGLYGARRELVELSDRFFLHALRIRVDLDAAVDWACPLPASLCAVLSRLGLDDPGLQPRR